MPKWQGTPEENYRMLKAAMIFFGASDIGISQLDEHHKKLVSLYPSGISESYFPYKSSPNWPPPTTVTQPVVFKDVPKFSYDSATGTTTIPSNISLYTVSYTIPQAHELFRTGPDSALSGAANVSRYRLRDHLRSSTQVFLKGIGYQSQRDEPYRILPGGAGAVLTGLAENARHTNMAISPEHGSTVGLYELMTDLPLEPTKPVDAGIWRFCHTCGKCAVFCPSGSIEPKGGREPSFEPPPSSVVPKHPPLPGEGFDPLGPGESEYYKLGRKTYWTDSVKCNIYLTARPRTCRFCYGSCVFNSQYGALIHDVVRSTVGTTGIFNSFFATMSGTFGFGPKTGEEIEEWWDMSLPSYGYSTAVGARHGGYK